MEILKPHTQYFPGQVENALEDLDANVFCAPSDICREDIVSDASVGFLDKNEKKEKGISAANRQGSMLERCRLVLSAFISSQTILKSPLLNPLKSAAHSIVFLQSKHQLFEKNFNPAQTLEEIASAAHTTASFHLLPLLFIKQILELSAVLNSKEKKAIEPALESIINVAIPILLTTLLAKKTFSLKRKALDVRNKIEIYSKGYTDEEKKKALTISLALVIHECISLSYLLSNPICSFFNTNAPVSIKWLKNISTLCITPLKLLKLDQKEKKELKEDLEKKHTLIPKECSMPSQEKFNEDMIEIGAVTKI